MSKDLSYTPGPLCALQETLEVSAFPDLFNQVIIFVRSTQRCQELDNLLRECNFPSTAVHSGIKQEERYVH